MFRVKTDIVASEHWWLRKFGHMIKGCFLYTAGSSYLTQDIPRFRVKHILLLFTMCQSWQVEIGG